MKRFTAEDVRALSPGLTETQVQAALAVLNVAPPRLRDRWKAENRYVAEDLVAPPPRNRDGLTVVEVAINAWTDARALPIPFPPG